MQVKIKIPDNLSEISLKKYQKYIEIAKNSQDSFFLMQKCISIFCEIDMATVLTFRYTDVEVICTKILSLFENNTTPLVQRFTLNGVEFGFIPNLEDLTIGEFPDIDNNIHNIETLHKALAVLYRPITRNVRENYEIESYQGTNTYSDVLQYVSMDVVIGVKVFFWNLSNDLLSGSMIFLSNLKKTPQNKTSVDIMDGIVVSLKSQMETFLKSNEQPKLI